jgi:hypothetical protein
MQTRPAHHPSARTLSLLALATVFTLLSGSTREADASSRAIGATCNNNNQCASRFCDAGWGTSHTNRCVPGPARGTEGQYCSNDNQCQTGKCAGLRPTGGGGWIGGKCTGKKALGSSCGNNNECNSGYCDAGWGTSHTSRCIPRPAAGTSGDYCSNDNQCRQGHCKGLRQSQGRWIGGQCAAKEPLGSACGANSHCASGRCDAAAGNPRRCIPNDGTGVTGDYCSHPNHCRYRICTSSRCADPPGVKVSGRVVDGRGRPVAGLTVKVWDVNPGVNTNVELGSAKTNANGAFFVQGKPYLDPPDAFGGGTFPDVRVTFETEVAYARSATRRSAQDPMPYWQPGVHGLGPGRSALGRTSRVGVWPAPNKEQRDHDPSRPIDIGTFRVPVNEWERVRTTFDPSKHGISFVNRDVNICWGPTCQPPWRSWFNTRQALCGGFSLVSLKRFVDRRCDTYQAPFFQRPPGDKLGANLKKMLVEHQLETFFFGTYHDGAFDIWQQLPQFGINALRFLEWQAKQDVPHQQLGNTIGASTKIEWAKVRQELSSRRLPVIIGQVNARAAPHNLLDIDIATRNHQVLAIGYDYNPFSGAVTIYIYDPNFPGAIKQLELNERLHHSQMYIHYDGASGHPIRGFFLNMVAPPNKTAPPACP